MTNPPVLDLLAKYDPLIAEHAGLLSTGIRDPFGIVMEKVLSPTEAIIKGRHTILLGTYNYMGMTFDADVIEAGRQALTDFGAGTTGSRVLNGTFRDHRDVEAALRGLECVVVQDLFLNETAMFAHVFLPGATFLEKDGTFTNATATNGTGLDSNGMGNTYADFNNDGWLDIYSLNGYFTAPKQVATEVDL